MIRTEEASVIIEASKTPPQDLTGLSGDTARAVAFSDNVLNESPPQAFNAMFQKYSTTRTMVLPECLKDERNAQRALEALRRPLGFPDALAKVRDHPPPTLHEALTIKGSVLSFISHSGP